MEAHIKHEERKLNEIQDPKYSDDQTAVGMTIGVLIEALLGGPSTSTPTSEGTSGGDKKGGAREWIKNKLKALLQLLGKLTDKALASLPGIIGLILSWILNRAKEVVGWLTQNLWALITGVGVLIYTYFMTRQIESSHLNIHHTVKTAVVPNIKATFSSS